MNLSRSVARATRGLAIALCFGLAVTSAGARTLYLVVEPARPEPGDRIVVRLLAGAPFAGAEIAHDRSDGARLERVWTSGRRWLGGDEPSLPAASVSVPEPGVQLFAYEPPVGSTDPARQRRDAWCKALVVVGAAEAGEKVWRSELGHRLEIVPWTDPVELATSGGSFEVQVLFDREPLVGAVVAAVPAAAPGAGYRRGMTGIDGRVAFPVDRAGPWMIHVAHKNPVPGGDPEWEILEASLVVVSGPEG